MNFAIKNLLNSCHNYIEKNCVLTKNTKLKSGTSSNVYYNIKEGIVRNPNFTLDICALINYFLNSNNIKYDTIAGVALGGVLISDRFFQNEYDYNEHLNYLVIRNNPKDYGIKDLVIGDYKKAKNVIIIEDVVTTGESVMSGINAIKAVNPNVNITAIITIVDRTNWFYSPEANWFKNNYCKELNCKYISIYEQKKVK